MIDSARIVGYYNSIAIDSNNKVHISYRDSSNRDLKYATNAYPIDLPRTGQTTSYAAGDDGTIQAGVAWPNPRFTDNLDQTVTDNLTWLIWTKDAGTPTVGSCTGGTKTWQGALDYVACLNSANYLGHNDWRLPNINELESLVNRGSELAGWLINQGFSNVQSHGYFWSSSTRAGYTAHAWFLYVYYGYTNTENKENWFFSVLPVRGGQYGLGNSAIWKTGQSISYADGDDGDLQRGVPWPSPRFTENGDQTVRDNLTGLIWSKDANAPGPLTCSPSGYKTWQAALDYITCLNTNNFLGYNDWRLPNGKELLSLIDHSQSPALPEGHPFINMQFTNNNYWSSSTVTNYSVAAETVGMSIGDGRFSPKYLQSNYVWPVRGGTIITLTDTTTDPFTFTDQTGVALNTVITSNTITVSSINAPASISVTGGEYSINSGAFTSSAGTVNNGNNVRVRQTSSSSYSTTTNATLTIGGVSDIFSVTTIAAPPDTTPDQFTYTDQTGVALSTQIISNSITASGINAPASISISVCTSIECEYSVNGGAFTSASGTVNNGDAVMVRQTSSGFYSTITSATLTIGGVSGTFSVTTTATSFGAISGQVTSSGGSGLWNIFVNVYNSVTGYYVASAYTDSNGNYTINGLPTGTYKVRFSGAEHGVQWYNNKLTQGSANAVSVNAPNTTTGINAVLTQAGGISGRVTDSLTSIGVGNVWVEARDATTGTGQSVSGTSTDPNGNYTITGLPSGSYKIRFYGVNTKYYGSTVYEVKWSDIITVTAPGITSGIDTTLQAVQSSYTVTPVVGVHGTVMPLTPQSVAYYSTAMFNIIPDPGYVVSVTGCGAVAKSVALSGSTFSTPAITGDCSLNVSFISITPGILTWTSKAEMPTAQVFPMSGAVDGKIYVFGGSAVEVYDTAADSWQSLSPMGQGITDAASTAQGDTIYLLGGKDNNQTILDTVYAYHTTNGSVELMGRINIPRFRASSVALNNKIYLIGGIDSTGGRLNTIEEYDISTHTSVVKTTLPSGRTRAGVAATGGKIYVFGGNDGYGPNNSVFMFDPAPNHVDILKPMPIAMVGVNPLVHSNGKIYLLDNTPATKTSIVQEYDPSTDSWRVVGDFVPSARFGSTQFIVNDQIYVIGGKNSAGQELKTNEVATMGISYHTVTPSSGANGSISPAVPQTVVSGTRISFTVTPDNGYDIAYVVGCGGTLSGNTYTTGIVTGDCPVQVSFTVSQPSLTIAPASHYVYLGKIYVGSSSIAKTITVRNTGRGLLTISNTTFTGAPHFAVVANSCLGQVLSYNASCNITVTFAPQTTGVLYGTLNVASNDLSNPSVDVLLAGEGVTTPAPHISLSANNVDFGNIWTGSLSTVQTIRVKNSGSADLLTGLVAHTGDADFSITADTCSQKALPPGTSCTLKAVFTPVVQGGRAATLVIPSNDVDNPSVGITLTGQGSIPQIPLISLSPASVSFGTVLVGASPNRAITVMNSGSENLLIQSVQLNGSANFSISGDSCSGVILYPSAYCKVVIKYHPISAGTASGLVSISSNDPYTPTATVSVDGTGVTLPLPHLTAYPATIAFYNAEVFSTTPAYTVTISNSGTGNLVIGQISKDGANELEFSVQNDACSGRTLTPSNGCSFDVVYSPVLAGAKTAAVNVPSNDPDMPLFSIALSGTTSPPQEAGITAVGADVKNVTVTDTVIGMPDGGVTTDMSLSFTAVNVTNAATFSFTFDSLSSNPVFYKMANGVRKQLYPINECSGTTDVSLADNTLTFTMQDNSACDDDPTPGIIMDPLVLGTLTGYNLTVSVSGNGIVTSSPVGISCGTSCNSSFDSDSMVTLTAVGASGYTFSIWSGDCSGTTSHFDVVVDSPKTCTATFTFMTDTTPNPFTFTDQTGVALNTLISSNSITVSGINAAAPISITGGKYSINGGAFTSASGTVNNGDSVRVRQTSSSSYSTTTNATLNIGGVSDTFTVMTVGNFSGKPVAAFSSGTSGYTVTLIDTSTDDAEFPANAVKVKWNDGTSDKQNAGTIFSHTYSKAGTYIVRMIVTDAGGKKAHINKKVTVPVKYTVSGKVVRLDGTTPVVGASIRLKKGVQVVKMATTNALGAYTLQNVSPGSYTVEAVKSGLTFSSTPATVVTNSYVTGVDITGTR